MYPHTTLLELYTEMELGCGHQQPLNTLKRVESSSPPSSPSSPSPFSEEEDYLNSLEFDMDLSSLDIKELKSLHPTS
jgi:hypothetical protein